MKKKILVLLTILALGMSACGEKEPVADNSGSQGGDITEQGSGNEGNADESIGFVYVEPEVEGIVSIDTNFTYVEENGEIIITGYEGEVNILNIPESIDNKPVTAIGKSAFYLRKDIMKVVFPTSMIRIEESAFSTCENLLVIKFNERLEKIGRFAFSHTATEYVAMPDTVNYIGEGAFDKAAIRGIKLSTSIEDIKSYTFSYSNIEKITIPGNVEKCESISFECCESLEEVIFEEGVERIYSRAFGNCYSLKSITFPSTLEFLHDDIINMYEELDHTITLKVPAGSSAEELVREKLGNKEYVEIVTY